MEVRALIFSILLIKILVLFNYINCDEVLGCGGFIKSHANIDFSKVEIKLLTKQGSLKDKTDCSPSNGYYFIPIYDKGEYILKISPPPGWSFEPETIDINFDGKTDKCSLGKDVNFAFKGFGITGKIGILEQTSGAKGVSVELQSDDGSDIRQTISDSNGVFYFTPVIPGKYTIRAKHDKWHFSKSDYTVVVKTGNTEIPENSLVVSGFDVQGKILGDGQPFSHAGIVLYSEIGKTSLSKCDVINLPKIQTINSKYEKNPLCYATVNKNNGVYVFSALAPGKYLILPNFKKADIQYHIRPEFIEFTIEKDNLEIKEIFEVTGFSVSGRVLTKEKGFGVPNAKIKLNGQDVTTTHTDGSYSLKNIKSGTYTIQVSADNLEFNDQTIKIHMVNPAIPDIIVQSFKVCGQVLSQDAHELLIKSQSSTLVTKTQSKLGTGEWCVYLTNGKYTVEVVVNENINDLDNRNQIQFFPLVQNIDVNATPISGIIFSQLRSTVVGEIKCLEDYNCNDITITMNTLDKNGKPNGQYITTVLKNNKYSFKDILPGQYEVKLPDMNICWEKSAYVINVKTTNENIPTFIHTGYVVKIISSHTVNMIYQLNDIKNDYNLEAGLNIFCLPKAGTYDVKFYGCHQYDNRNVIKTISTKETIPYKIQASKHQTGVRVLSEDNSKIDLFMEKNSFQGLISLVDENIKIDNYYVYRYDFYLGNEETIKLFPKSETLIIQPSYKELVGDGDCSEVAFTFIAKKGKIIKGKVLPEIQDVKITLSYPENKDLQSTSVMSNEKGEFKFGPIDNKLKIDLIAEKESYIFDKYNFATNEFKANKLCEIIVEVVDNETDNNKLSGVLLSLSGGENYRKNLITNINGIIKFQSLKPNQYFLRPMMKEYIFEPNSKIIDIQDGATENIKLIGTRVAYSIYGNVNSLNGEPFNNIVVEAVSDDNCMNHQEETTSEISGQYRIRGLKPNCNYIIRIKKLSVNNLIDRSLPNQIPVIVENTDINNINFIGINQLNFVDITLRIFSTNIDYYKTLRVLLYKKGNFDNPIYSQRLDTQLLSTNNNNINKNTKINNGIMLLLPRIPNDNKYYVIELTTTLSDKNFKYNLPIIQFQTNQSSIYYEINFQPEIRFNDNDINNNSIIALLLIIIIFLIYIKQQFFINLLKISINFINNYYQNNFNKNFINKNNFTNENNKNYDNKEIEQLANSINSIKNKNKKITKKIN